ncbi:TPA: hypothetical protein DIC38_00290 [Candidatus Nomurabacteria bacterium]|nr:MAG: Glycosidase PH1107-related protein [Parcubacteria bacterium RAAC4_OD1_1]HCY26115.1 hypothetical protein [Candidatus Nomurabacteria bacterium]
MEKKIKKTIKKRKPTLIKKGKVKKNESPFKKIYFEKDKIFKLKVKSDKPKIKTKRVFSKKDKKNSILKDVKKLTKVEKIKLERSIKNPILIPRSYSWESQAVFNPAVVLSNKIFHLFYRALGDDGISRIGYASSKDGVNFYNRLSYPVYFLSEAEETKAHWPFTSPARALYDRDLYKSGGGWGGCEDPRGVLIDGEVYLTLNIFNGWNNLGVAFTSIKEEDLLKKKWNWKSLKYLSHTGDRQKNWMLFPEKINDKFVVFHNLDKGNPNEVYITYTDKLDWRNMPTIKDAPDPQVLPDHIVAWHKRTRSASAPPIKTKYGWLLLYHAMDNDGSDRYKLGAMLLDLKDPRKVICRAGNPILEPDKWYENDWKPGIIYASGAVVKNGKLFVYYGGGDKYIGVASIELDKLIEGMKKNTFVKLEKNKKLKIK